MDTDPAVAATAQTSEAPVSRAQTVRRSRCADGHSVRAALRHPVGDAPAGNGLRLRHELLAPTARLAASRSLGPVARSTAGQTACGRSHRLVTCHRRLFLYSCCGIRSKTGPNPTDRARPGSKHHLVTEAQGIPLALILTGANRHDVTQLLPLIDAIPPIRGKRGRPLSKPAIVQGDRGYDHDKYRRPLHAAGIPTQIARRGSRTAVALAKPDGSLNAQSLGCITSGACAFASNASPSFTKRS